MDGAGSFSDVPSFPENLTSGPLVGFGISLDIFGVFMKILIQMKTFVFTCLNLVCPSKRSGI